MNDLRMIYSHLWSLPTARAGRTYESQNTEAFIGNANFGRDDSEIEIACRRAPRNAIVISTTNLLSFPRG